MIGVLTVVIKAMDDLMADHHPDAPKVESLQLILMEEWGLQNSSRENCRSKQSQTLQMSGGKPLVTVSEQKVNVKH